MVKMNFPLLICFVAVFTTNHYLVAQNDLPDDPSRAREVIPGCEVILASARNSSGNHVRVVITRPLNLKGKAPALMFLPWLSCLSVEAPDPKRRPQSVRVLQEIASKSGFVTVRVEKPGLADSEG